MNFMIQLIGVFVGIWLGLSLALALLCAVRRMVSCWRWRWRTMKGTAL